MNITDLPPLLTIDEAAPLLGMTERALRDRIERGQFAELVVRLGHRDRPSIRLRGLEIQRLLTGEAGSAA